MYIDTVNSHNYTTFAKMNIFFEQTFYCKITFCLVRYSSFDQKMTGGLI